MENEPLIPHRKKSKTLESKIREKKPNFFVSLAVINASAGSGILSIPYAMSRSGLLLGPIIFIISGIINFASLRLLLRASRASAFLKKDDDETDSESSNHSSPSTVQLPMNSYEQMSSILGTKWTLGVQLLVFLDTFFSMVASADVVGQLSEDIIGHFPESAARFSPKAIFRFACAMVAFVLILPACIPRTLSSRFVIIISVIAAVSVALLTSYCVALFRLLGFASSDLDLAATTGSTNVFMFTTNPWMIFQTLAIATFMFSCHLPLPEFIRSHELMERKESQDEENGEERRPLFQRLMFPSAHDPLLKVLSVTITWLAICYVILGAAAYAILGQDTGGEVLASIEAAGMPGVKLARILAILAVAANIPMLLFPCRSSVDSFVALLVRKNQQIEKGSVNGPSNGYPFEAAETSRARHILEALLLLLCSAGFTLLFPQIAFLFSLMGSITAPAANLIMPPILHAKIVRGLHEPLRWKEWTLIGIAVFSSVSGIASLFISPE